jgi:predicted SAM-dependent methyltransferase
MNQKEIFEMDKEEATQLLIDSEILRMRLENDIAQCAEQIKEYRKDLRKAQARIDQLSIIANKKDA